MAVVTSCENRELSDLTVFNLFHSHPEYNEFIDTSLTTPLGGCPWPTKDILNDTAEQMYSIIF